MAVSRPAQKLTVHSVFALTLPSCHVFSITLNSSNFQLQTKESTCKTAPETLGQHSDPLACEHMLNAQPMAAAMPVAVAQPLLCQMT